MIKRIMQSMAIRRDELKKDDKGFTLIELLVVVIIIGILAAIAIPVYLGIQNSAKESGVQTDATNAKIAAVAYQTDKGALPADGSMLPTAVDAKYGATKGDNTSAVTITAAGTTGFCVEATGANGAADYAATDTQGAKKGTCDASGAFVAATP